MGVLIRGGGMGWRRVRPGQTALGGTVQPAAAAGKSKVAFPRASSSHGVAGRQTGRQQCGVVEGGVYKEAVKDTSEEK